MFRKLMWGTLALMASTSAWARKDATLDLRTVPHAWVVFEEEGERNPVNEATGQWIGSALYTDLGEIHFRKGTFVRVVVRAPGYAPMVRLLDTRSRKITVPLERIDLGPDLARSYGDGMTDAGVSVRLSELLKANPEANPEAKALQSWIHLSRATHAAEVEAAMTEATAVIEGGATGPVKSTALATQALGRMELWRLAAVSGKGEETRVGGAQWNELREATLRAAKAWVESGTHDRRATKLCLAAEGTRAECGLSVDPIFR